MEGMLGWGDGRRGGRVNCDQDVKLIFVKKKRERESKPVEVIACPKTWR